MKKKKVEYKNWKWDYIFKAMMPVDSHGKFITDLQPEDVSYSFTRSWKKKDCHKGNKLTFVDPISDLKFYGGGETREVKEPSNNTLILDLNGTFDPKLIFYGVKIPQLEKYNTKRIRFSWPDMGIMNFPKSFWIDLISYIRKEKLNVLVCCMGGHGRTGTVLAILASLTGACKKDKDPIIFVRDNYCKLAVESSSQYDYVDKISGFVYIKLQSKLEKRKENNPVEKGVIKKSTIPHYLMGKI